MGDPLVHPEMGVLGEESLAVPGMCVTGHDVLVWWARAVGTEA